MIQMLDMRFKLSVMDNGTGGWTEIQTDGTDRQSGIVEMRGRIQKLKRIIDVVDRDGR